MYFERRELEHNLNNEEFAQVKAMKKMGVGAVKCYKDDSITRILGEVMLLAKTQKAMNGTRRVSPKAILDYHRAVEAADEALKLLVKANRELGLSSNKKRNRKPRNTNVEAAEAGGDNLEQVVEVAPAGISAEDVTTDQEVEALKQRLIDDNIFAE